MNNDHNELEVFYLKRNELRNKIGELSSEVENKLGWSLPNECYDELVDYVLHNVQRQDTLKDLRDLIHDTYEKVHALSPLACIPYKY